MKREELLATLDIGATIKQLRERKGLSQEELANGICDRTNITKLENGHSKIPSLTFVLLICEKLEITIQDFINFATHNSYCLDRKKILDYLMNKEFEKLEEYIITINGILLSSGDQQYYKFIKGLIFFKKGDIESGKTQLLPLLSDTTTFDYISLLSFHELLKHNCITNKSIENKIYSQEFVKTLVNKHYRKEYLYFINELLEKTIESNNKSLSLFLLEKELFFINLHECYRYLPIYYKNKIRIYTSSPRLIKEIENKILSLQSNKK